MGRAKGKRPAKSVKNSVKNSVKTNVKNSVKNNVKPKKVWDRTVYWIRRTSDPWRAIEPAAGDVEEVRAETGPE
jgi:hypothetical protein